MKKHLLVLFTLFFFNTINSQVVVDTTGVLGDSFDRWSVHLFTGQGKGIRPYADGYFSSNPDQFLGGAQLNTYGIGARYMLSPKFGFKLDFTYDDLKNQSNSESLDFEMVQYRTSFEGVVNLIRLFDIQEPAGRFGFLFHAGFQVAAMRSKVLDKTELNGGIIGGLSPQFRLTKKLSLITDFSLLLNFRQHFNWDGSMNDPSNNLSGSMVSSAIGLSYSIGNGKLHGDWAIIKDKNDLEIEELNKRIGEIETQMNDSDKDGVPDYLDVENNSIAGVAVDTKGRMVDKNNNGVPDDLEKYVDNSITTNNTKNANTNNTNSIVEQLINEGYIAAYFDLNKNQPNISSADNIGFVLNYLKNNPSKTVDIIGYADETGDSKYNEKLSAERSNNVKAILVNAGIDASRLNIIGNGVDKSVDKKSAYARRLVRKVVFKVK